MEIPNGISERLTAVDDVPNNTLERTGLNCAVHAVASTPAAQRER